MNNPQTEAELTAELAKMAEEASKAEGFLGSLVAALFPGGTPGTSEVTWPERAARPEQEKPQTAEERIRSAEVRFRTLVEQIPAVTFLAVLGDGKNEIYVSPHIEQMLGFSQQEWLEAPFLWYWQLHPDDRQVWNEEFTRGCQTGGPFKAECRFIARDGHIVWVRGEARLVKDELGRPMLLQGIAFDITESKQAQEVLLKEATRTAKEQQELAIARRVQTSILPKQMNVAGLELSASMVPAEDVGGDYYDVQPVQGGAWLAIGDVSGHGLDSGLVMMMLQSALAGIFRARPELGPRDALLFANTVLFDNVRARLLHDDHVTLTLLRYQEDGTVTFAGAHEDIVLVRASGTVELVRTPGTWVAGMREISEATVESKLKLQPGDVMVLYTDGVTEAMNGNRELFELERLSASVQALRGKSAQDIRDGVLADVRKWMDKQHDDITVFVARYTGAGASVSVAPSNVHSAPAAVRGLVTRSHFDQKAGIPVQALTTKAPEGRLGSRGEGESLNLCLHLLGSADSADAENLATLLTALHGTARAGACKLVEVDLRGLRFMPSSCLKQLVSWLSSVVALPAAERYQVRFVGDPAVRWHRTSVAALSAFAPEIMAVD